jgi:hypothetical protein
MWTSLVRERARHETALDGKNPDRDKKFRLTFPRPFAFIGIYGGIYIARACREERPEPIPDRLRVGITEPGAVEARPIERLEMTRTLLALLVITTLHVTARAQEPLSDAVILTAIQAGENKKYDQLISGCNAHAGFGENFGASMAGGLQNNGSYSVVVAGNEGAIAVLAARGKRTYKRVTLENLPGDLRTPAIFVTVEPDTPSRTKKEVAMPAPIEHIVLKSKANSEAVAQPMHIDMEPVEFSNLLGAKLQSTRAIARFDIAAVKELPPGDFDVVVVSTAGERRCKVDAKDRAKLNLQ